MTGDIAGYLVPVFLDRIQPVQTDIGHKIHRMRRMGVGIDESGQDHLALEVNHNHIRPKIWSETLVGAGIDDSATRDGHRLDPIAPLVDCIDCTVFKNEILV